MSRRNSITNARHATHVGALGLISLVLILAASARATPIYGNIETAVGGSNGDGGPAINAVVEPRGVSVCNGNLYIADGMTNQIRVVQFATGNIETIAGTGVAGFSGDGQPGTAAQLNFPTEVLCDGNGNVYVADTSNNRVRLIDPSGLIQTIAGNGSNSSGGDGGAAKRASLSAPRGLALDLLGNLYITEFSGNRVRKVSSNGIISTVAGTGGWGQLGDGGPATRATLSNPSSVALDPAGNLFIADYNSSKIRRVSASDSIITTIAGDGYQGFSGDGGEAIASRLKQPYRLRFDSNGNLFFLDMGNNRVRRLAAIQGFVSPASVITTVAGNGANGSIGDGGPATSASFWYLNGLAIDNFNRLFIGVTTNTVQSPDNRVRVIDPWGTVTTIVGSGNGDGGLASRALIDPRGLVISTASGSNGIYIADGNNNRIRYVDGATKVISTVAGSGTPCMQPTAACGDGGLAVNAALRSPFAVAVDGSGTLYIADTLDNRIRKVTNGVITSFAGTGGYGYSGDNGLATAASFAYPYGVAVTSDGGTVYVADFSNNRIRKISGNIVTTFAGTGNFGLGGDGLPPTQTNLSAPTDVALAPDGTVYIADYGNHLVRRVLPNGRIERFAGIGGSSGYSGDGGPALSAQLNHPFRLALDDWGNVYISDADNKRVRRVNTATGLIETIAGNGMAGINGDGGPAILADLYRPSGLGVDSGGQLYIGQSESSRVRVMAAVAITSPTATQTLTPTPTRTSTFTRTATQPPAFTPTQTMSSTATSSARPAMTATPAPGSFTLAGKVRYFSNSEPIAQADVHISSPGRRSASGLSTDGSGNYQEPGLSMDTWAASVSKQDNGIAAITAYDAVVAMQAGFGLRQLQLLERIACDADGNGDASLGDAALLLQIAVGNRATLPVADRCKSQWLFAAVNPDVVQNQIVTPPILNNQACTPGTITIDPLVTNATNQNFVGVLLGDCDGSWRPAGGGGGGSAASAGRLVAGRARSKNGRVVVPLFLEGNTAAQSVEVRLRYEAGMESPHVTRTSGSRGALMQVNKNVPGELRIAMASAAPLPEGPVLYVSLEQSRPQRNARPVQIVSERVE